MTFFLSFNGRFSLLQPAFSGSAPAMMNPQTAELPEAQKQGACRNRCKRHKGFRTPKARQNGFSCI
jgi:hypothetical protein